MKKLCICFIILSALAINAYAQSNARDFARYEVILRRQPFGSPPARPTTPAPPRRPEDDPFKNYRLVGVTRGDDGDISVGIVDIGSKPPKSIFLNVGGFEEGIRLLDADYELEGALIRKDNEEKWLYLGGSGGTGSGNSVASSYTVSSSAGAKNSNSKGVKSYIERMRERRARRGRTQTTVIEPPKLKGDALKKHLQEYNMELIRKAAKGEGSGPPLPIQLTPEQDEQLVEEGVLPPQE